MIKESVSSFLLIMLLSAGTACTNSGPEQVPGEVMKQVYEKVKTPYKYGLVIVPENEEQKVDCRSIFRDGDRWYMTYIVYEGRGYETWLAESKDLMNWTKKGRILSFSDSTDWDANQKSGDVALRDYPWGGSYKLQPYGDKYWMSYYGGTSTGYEAGKLSMGIAYTRKSPSTVHEWNRLEEPVLAPDDKTASWWDNAKMYKSTVIWDKSRSTGYPFVMFYNAKGDSVNPDRGAERIGMAVSENMTDWHRFGDDPVLDHHEGITGNPAIQKMGDLWVMFYFGAFYGGREDAFDSFAASYDLEHWTDWNGPKLIEPSKPYDARFAHKPIVIKHEDVVYHFYCAVNKQGQRGIALAASMDLGQSTLDFPKTN